MGASYVDLGAAYMSAYLSTGQNSYLGAYPGVGAYAGDYGIAFRGLLTARFLLPITIGD